mgnify:CR=1 FL=1
MYDALGKRLGAAVLYFAGHGGWTVSFRGQEVGVLTWLKDEPMPTLEQLQEALWKGDWSEVRKHRNELLVETDWYALSDVTMSDDMATYRQALRDLPASVENSEDVVWPEKP